MSYKSVREILNSVFDSDDHALKTIFKTDGEVLNMVLDESGDPALKVRMDGSAGSGLTDEEKMLLPLLHYNACRNPDCTLNQREVTSASAPQDYIADGFYNEIDASTGVSSALSMQSQMENKQWIKLTGDITDTDGRSVYGVGQKIPLDSDSINAGYFSFDVYSDSGGDIYISCKANYGGGQEAEEESQASVVKTLPAGHSRVSIPLSSTNYCSKVIWSYPYLSMTVYKIHEEKGVSYTGDLYLTNFKRGYTDRWSGNSEIKTLSEYHFFERIKALNAYAGFGAGTLASTTQAIITIDFQKKYKKPNILLNGNFSIRSGNELASVNSLVGVYKTDRGAVLTLSVSSGLSAPGAGCVLEASETGASIDISAEI